MANDYAQPIDDSLIGKYLAGETDPDESERVRLWLSQRDPSAEDDNQKEFERFERIWETVAQLKPPSEERKAPVDTDAAWQKMRSRMQTGGTTSAPAPSPFTVVRSDEKDVAGTERNDPVVKPLQSSPQPVRSLWSRYWQIAAALVLVSGLGWFLLKNQQAGPAPVPQLAVTSASKTVEKILPDGSKVWLNRGSKLSYPQTFGDDSRDVALTGEAFFEVKPDPTKPFRIRAGQATVQVLGTSFSVRAYDSNVRVAVRTGKVLFSAKKKEVTLVKDEQATFDSQADTIRKSLKVDPNLFAYRTGRLAFKGTRLSEVVQTINEVYRADVRLANNRLTNCLYANTGFENYDTVETVVYVVAETMGLRVRREGDRFIIEGEGCPQ
ncbi:anti-FecI sigma factor, FecR [Fibrisoma limi BUZ 3]|uniref:Anti-FecI sigma factor, FecR n=1 Tax=Fibrisoma limi BUZ 3 TaxID=1185876 RepID=I2GBF6_9BACT|nr:FecR domain-containing protein [Fibrisoma limi]CCH51230.1 anti-FecI sigma factor, FecR [Fibrisoma limi BUZ 3]